MKGLSTLIRLLSSAPTQARSLTRLKPHVVETMQCFAEVATFRQRLIAAGPTVRFREGHASRRRVDVETRDGDVDEVVGG